ncbi:MAG: ferrochelatase [Thermoplasmata archaeon]
MNEKAVALMYYGFPERKEEMADYLRHILHGRDPPERLLRENLKKLELIGGTSPSQRIVEGIRRKVEERLRGEGYKVYLLSKHYRPSLRDAKGIIREEAVFEVPLFPIYSDYVFSSYFQVLEETLAGRRFIRISNIGFEEALLGYYRDMIKGDEDYLLVFSAHSIPLESQDEYPGLVEMMSNLLSGGREHVNIFHSQGPFHSNWLTPYPEFSIEYATKNGFAGLKLVPIGFIYEHLEVLYDLDLELRSKAMESGLGYKRVPLPNDSQCVIDSIVDLVHKNDPSLRKA